MAGYQTVTRTQCFKALCLLAVILSLAACTTAKIFPGNPMPRPEPPEVYVTITPATTLLDCLSQALKPYRQRDIRVVFGHLLNTIGAQVGELTLPQNLRQYALDAFGRIGHVFEVYDVGDPRGKPLLPPNGLPQGASIPPELLISLLEAWKIRPTLILQGELVHAQELKSSAIEADVIYLGGKAKVRAYDITTSLAFVHSVTLRYIGTPVKKRVRIYTAEQGAFVFVLYGDKFSRVDGTFVRLSAVDFAITYLVEHSVAMLIREIAIANFKLPTDVCTYPDVALPTGQVPDRSPRLPSGPQYRVELHQGDGRFCFELPQQAKAALPAGEVKIVWRQSRSQTIPVGQPFTDVQHARVLHNSVCLLAQYVNPSTQILEVMIYESGTNRVFAYGRVDL